VTLKTIQSEADRVAAEKQKVNRRQVHFTDSVLETTAEEGYTTQLGARSISTYIRQYITSPIIGLWARGGLATKVHQIDS
jgi:ATP-dependent Clp protease ATP-binding subunit ClpA